MPTTTTTPQFADWSFDRDLSIQISFCSLSQPIIQTGTSVVFLPVCKKESWGMHWWKDDQTNSLSYTKWGRTLNLCTEHLRNFKAGGVRGHNDTMGMCPTPCTHTQEEVVNRNFTNKHLHWHYRDLLILQSLQSPQCLTL
jgi:hypothetical protein